MAMMNLNLVSNAVMTNVNLVNQDRIASGNLAGMHTYTAILSEGQHHPLPTYEFEPPVVVQPKRFAALGAAIRAGRLAGFSGFLASWDLLSLPLCSWQTMTVSTTAKTTSFWTVSGTGHTRPNPCPRILNDHDCLSTDRSEGQRDSILRKRNATFAHRMA